MHRCTVLPLETPVNFATAAVYALPPPTPTCARVVLVGHLGEAQVELEGGVYAAVAYLRFALVAVGDPITMRLCCRVDGPRPEMLDPPRDITARVVSVSSVLRIAGDDLPGITLEVVVEPLKVRPPEPADRAPIVAWETDDVGYVVQAEDQTVTRSGRLNSVERRSLVAAR